MTDDFVKRLREDAPRWARDEKWMLAKQLEAAADRIEQLQAALYDVMQLLPRSEWYYLKPETKAALGEKQDD